MMLVGAHFNDATSLWQSGLFWSGLVFVFGLMPFTKIMVITDEAFNVHRLFKRSETYEWSDIYAFGVTAWNKEWLLLKDNRVVWLGSIAMGLEIYKDLEQCIGRPIVTDKKPEWVVNLRKHGMLRD